MLQCELLGQLAEVGASSGGGVEPAPTRDDDPHDVMSEDSVGRQRMPVAHGSVIDRDEQHRGLRSAGEHLARDEAGDLCWSSPLRPDGAPLPVPRRHPCPGPCNA